MSPITRERLAEVVRLGAEHDDVPVEASNPRGRPQLALVDADLILGSARTIGFLKAGEVSPERAWKPQVHASLEGLTLTLVRDLTPAATTAVATQPVVVLLGPVPVAHY